MITPGYRCNVYNSDLKGDSKMAQQIAMLACMSAKKLNLQNSESKEAPESCPLPPYIHHSKCELTHIVIKISLEKKRQVF